MAPKRTSNTGKAKARPKQLDATIDTTSEESSSPPPSEPSQYELVVQAFMDPDPSFEAKEAYNKWMEDFPSAGTEGNTLSCSPSYDHSLGGIMSGNSTTVGSSSATTTIGSSPHVIYQPFHHHCTMASGSGAPLLRPVPANVPQPKRMRTRAQGPPRSPSPEPILDAYGAPYRPFDKVAVVIKSLIFGFAIKASYGNGNYKAALTLAHVSQAWRQILLRSGSFWAIQPLYLNVTPTHWDNDGIVDPHAVYRLLSYAQLVFKMTGNKPIEVVVRFFGKGPAMLLETALEPYFGRISRFVIYCTAGSEMAAWFLGAKWAAMNEVGGKLQIHGIDQYHIQDPYKGIKHDSDCEDPWGNENRFAPMLRMQRMKGLALTPDEFTERGGVYVKNAQPLFDAFREEYSYDFGASFLQGYPIGTLLRPGLTRLRIDSLFRRDISPRLEEIWTAMKESKGTLEYISLCGLEHVMDTLALERATERTSFSRLHTLVLEDGANMSNTLAVLHLIKAPNLRINTLVDTLDQIYQYIGQMSDSLKELYLYGVQYPHALQDCFSRLTDLEVLHLVEAPVNEDEVNMTILRMALINITLEWKEAARGAKSRGQEPCRSGYFTNLRELVFTHCQLGEAFLDFAKTGFGSEGQKLTILGVSDQFLRYAPKVMDLEPVALLQECTISPHQFVVEPLVGLQSPGIWFKFDRDRFAYADEASLVGDDRMGSDEWVSRDEGVQPRKRIDWQPGRSNGLSLYPGLRVMMNKFYRKSKKVWRNLNAQEA